MSNTTNSTNSQASVLLSGGLTILSTQNSTGLTSGGNLTLLGGASINKDLYLGGSFISTGAINFNDITQFGLYDFDIISGTDSISL